jgi:Holliday junction resolvase RusA-like endonuclease
VIKIVVPMEPMGVNHYVRHTRSGAHYKTPEAIAYEQAGAIACRGLAVSAKSYRVRIDIYQGAKKKGDIDGYAKQPLDLLANNGVLLDRKGKRSTDAHVTELHMTKQRDHANPRTEIFVEEID